MERKITDLTEPELRAIIREEVLAVSKELAGIDPPTGDYVDINNAIVILSISKSKLYKMVGLNEIPYAKQGPKKLLFKVTDLQEWLIQNRQLDCP